MNKITAEEKEEIINSAKFYNEMFNCFNGLNNHSMYEILEVLKVATKTNAVLTKDNIPSKNNKFLLKLDGSTGDKGTYLNKTCSWCYNCEWVGSTSTFYSGTNETLKCSDIFFSKDMGININ